MQHGLHERTFYFIIFYTIIADLANIRKLMPGVSFTTLVIKMASRTTENVLGLLSFCALSIVRYP
jgi:hypothetical protein